MVPGKCFHIVVPALPEHGLRIQQVAHRGSARTIIILVQAQIFCGLADGLAGYEDLLVGVFQIIPCLLHPYDEQFEAVGHLVFGIPKLQLLLLDGMRPTPPAGQRYGNRGKGDAERMGMIHQIIVQVTCTDCHRRQVLAYRQPGLQNASHS